MATDPAESHDRSRQKTMLLGDGQSHKTVLLAGLLAIACLLGFLQWRASASTQDSYMTALHQLDQMQADARRVGELRRTPHSAAGRRRPNEELLAQIEQALTAASIDRGRWHDSIPQPAARLPKGDYTRHTTRLYFEDITLKQLAAFTYHLQSNDPTLHLTALHLTNRRPESDVYSIDLAVSYLVYAPQS